MSMQQQIIEQGPWFSIDEAIATILILVLSWGFTNAIKRLVVHKYCRIQNRRNISIRTVAFFVGVGFCFLLWPMQSRIDTLIAALVFGLWNPTVYWFTVFLIQERWPNLTKHIKAGYK